MSGWLIGSEEKIKDKYSYLLFLSFLFFLFFKIISSFSSKKKDYFYILFILVLISSPTCHFVTSFLSSLHL